MLKSGQTWAGIFVTRDADGSLKAPSSGPTGTLYIDGSSNSATVTITGSNPYKFSVTLPTLTAGQRVDMYITATISSIATAGIVASDQADTAYISNVKSDTADILADTGTDGVLLSVGTGSKQIDLSSGKVLLQPTQTGVTIPTVTNLTNLPTMPTDWISAAGVKADAVTKIQSGLATAAALTVVSGYVDELETRLTAARAGYLDKLNVSGALANTDNANSFKADVSNLALEATLTAIKGPGWSNETLVALMEAIDNISIDSGATPQQIWEYVSRTLTDASGLGLATEASQNLISNDLNAMPGKVWNHPTRTLTQSGSTVEYPAEGDPLVIYRDTTVAISLVNLGNVTGADKMWFTVKDNVEDVDSKSIIQIDTNGLQYINGAPAGSAIVDGGIVINDPALGNISIFLKQEQAARLPLYEAYPTRWDVKVLKDGIVTILNIGSMYIKGTPTRAIL